MLGHRSIRVRIAQVATSMAALTLLMACDGQNLFVGPAVTGRVDLRPPTVQILTPSPTDGSPSAKPLGDSVLVTVLLSDDVGLDSVRFEGVSFRGDVNLGTDTVVTRFESKVVLLLTVPEDTTVSRFLIAVPDTIKETSQIIAHAFDTLGNVASDTVQLVLGGPDVQVINLADGDVIQAGRDLSVRLEAQDPQGITSVRIDLTGAVTLSMSQAVNPPLDTAVVDLVIPIPPLATGPMQLVARARNGLGVSGQAGTLNITVVSSQAGDIIPPTVKFESSSGGRLEQKDLVTVVVTARDDNQGSGISTLGITVLAISQTRGDTLIQSNSVTFPAARTGTVAQDLTFPVFNADPLALPDTLVFEVTAFAVDAQGNCSSSVGLDTLVALPCAVLPTGQTAALNTSGLRDERIIVAGRTVLLPTGGLIMDAAVDTARGNLYLSNHTRDQVEIFRLAEEDFLPAVPVGSEPWGLAMHPCYVSVTLPGCGDSLWVANSGGTNVSVLDLASGPAPFERPSRRFLTPDVVLWDVEEAEDANGTTTWLSTFIPTAQGKGFSDRPQFIAQDFTGRVLYSTKVTELGDLGTIRKAFSPGGPDPEVVLFTAHGGFDEAPEFRAIKNVDFVTNGIFTDPVLDLGTLVIRDHPPGDLQTTMSFGPATLDNAIALAIAGGSDIEATAASRWNVGSITFNDTTFVTASGNGAWVAFGEGSVEPVGRIISYDAAADVVTGAIPVTDLMTNPGETVRGLGLNFDGTLGVARGVQAYFFTVNDLRLQGVADLPGGGSGAVLHPLHANARSLTNPAGIYRPDTHLAFIGTGVNTVDIIDTFHFFRSGRIFIRDVVSGPLRAVLPSATDNAGLTCRSTPVTGLDALGTLVPIGNAIEIFAGGDFQTPHPAVGAPTEDSCIVLKLFGVTDSGGVVVIDVRKSDILRDHPSRQ
ncbi:MAG: hypothetical protein BMS9Abin29_0588 [Gemmatimonadota bacterium]|nr:MAG: hypothetical protein BMS9Abin29_0588 [Gemmatimonadota bacterium]